MKNWKDHAKRLIMQGLEIGFCIYLTWVIFSGFVNCPLAMERREAICFLLCAAGLAIAVSVIIYFLLEYSRNLEKENEKLEEKCFKLEIRLKVLEENKKKEELENAGIREKITD